MRLVTFGHFVVDVILQYLYRISNRHGICNRVPLDVYIYSLGSIYILFGNVFVRCAWTLWIRVIILTD